MGLVDDVIQNLNKEVNNIKARSHMLLKVYNLSQEIKDLEQQKTVRLTSIGTVIYDKYQKQIMPDDESLQRRCVEIAALEQDITRLQKQLADLKEQKNSRANSK